MEYYYIEIIAEADKEKLKKLLQTLLIQSVSYFDTVGENFYHSFMLCLVVLSFIQIENRGMAGMVWLLVGKRLKLRLSKGGHFRKMRKV